MSFVILIVYLILQIINFFGMLVIFAGPSVDNIWWLILIVPQYWIVRQLALEICRLIGYHALPRMASFGDGGKVIQFPIFTKITPEYKQQYKERSRLYQFLYYMTMICYWMLIVALGIIVYSKFLPLFNDQNMIIKVILLILLVFIAFAGSAYLTTAFERWFKLEIIAEEAERPIFRIKID